MGYSVSSDIETRRGVSAPQLRLLGLIGEQEELLLSPLVKDSILSSTYFNNSSVAGAAPKLIHLPLANGKSELFFFVCVF